jgi:hypothetical protein
LVLRIAQRVLLDATHDSPVTTVASTGTRRINGSRLAAGKTPNAQQTAVQPWPTRPNSRRPTPNSFGNLTAATLNPDELAETVWRLYTERTKAEAVINALAP